MIRQSKKDKIYTYKVDYSPLLSLLKKKKLSRRKLEIMSGIGHSTVTSIGKGLPISMKALLKICAVLECEVNDVMKVKGLNQPYYDKYGS